jgi:hypothetical protein
MQEDPQYEPQTASKSTFILKANGLYQDGKVHLAARFPPSHAAQMSGPNQTWSKPITAARDMKCSVNSVELGDVPMHQREKFIDKLIEKRHYHSLIIEDSSSDNKKRNAVEGRYQSAESSYVIFEAEFDGPTMKGFNVIPIKEWYHFKGVQTSQFTAEEAEKFISSQAVNSVGDAFNFHSKKLEKERDEKSFKKEHADFPLDEFKISNGKTGKGGEDEEDDPFGDANDYSDDADVSKKEKISFYKEPSSDTGKISMENKKVWKLAQTEGGMEVDDDIDEDDDEDLQNIINKSTADKEGAPSIIKPEQTSGKKGKKKRSGDDSLSSIQPKKKIVREVQELPEGALTELQFEAEIRNFFLIRPAIELKQLLAHFKLTIKATPGGDKLLLKICKRICKKLDANRSDGVTILVLKDDNRTYH